MFYTLRQNNSGGSFEQDEMVNIYTIIEAVDAREARDRAKWVGIYFNGCSKDIDCTCCGDRWSDYFADEGYAEPTIYGEKVASLTDSVWDGKFGRRGHSVVVHYLDGTRMYGTE